MELAHHVAGTAVRGTIIACHGVTDNAASLADIAARFGAQWRVVLVDTLGHGVCARFTKDQLQAPIEAAAHALAELCERLGKDGGGPVVLYGHSMGGALATLLAIERPELAAALVLDDPAWFTPEQAASFAAGTAERLEIRAKAIADPCERIAWCRRLYPNWPVAETLGWAQAKTQTDVPFLETGQAGLVRPRTELAGALRTPALLVTGDQPDCLFGPAGVAELEAAGLARPFEASSDAPRSGDGAKAPTLRTLVLSGATHTVRRDAAEGFYAAMEDFLDSLPEAEASASEARSGQGKGAAQAWPEPYLRPEALDLLPGMPPQTTWDVAKLRAEGESFLSEVPALPEGVNAVWSVAPAAGREPVRMREVSVRRPTRAVVSIHGGGYIAGSAAYDDLINAEIALALNARVFVPEYRLAPEHPYPAGLEDCLAAIDVAAGCGLPLTVYGDSAGGGLALAAACRLCGWGPAGQPGSQAAGRALEALDSLVLLEPCADPRQDNESFSVHADGPVWTAEASGPAWSHYLGSTPASELLPEAMIDAAAASGRFPATFVAANFVDPLRDEAIAIATRLADRGVRTELRIPDGTYHATLSAHGTPVWAELRRAIAAFIGL